MWRSAVQVCLGLQCEVGGLAQLARALAWHARGHRFDPDILHNPVNRMTKAYATVNPEKAGRDL